MTQMLIMVINDNAKLETILDNFVRIGIRGATILDSIGMGRFLIQNTSIFSNLHSLIRTKYENSKTVFAVSKHEEKMDKAVEMILDVMHDFKHHDSGFLIVVPVSKAYGFACPLEDCDD